MRIINYKERICDKCGNTFIPTSSTQQWCSDCLMKNCEYCGKVFSVGKKSKYETSKFCSRECQGKYRSEHLIGDLSTAYKNGNRTKISFVCDYCGKTSKKEKKQLENFEHHFCSQKCQVEFYQCEENKIKGKDNPRYTKKEVYCEWCGNVFTVYASVADKTRFCSKQCRNNWQSDMMKGEKHPNWDGGKTQERQRDMISREYKTWRKAVFERDNYTCQICGDKRGHNLRAHHIKTWADYPELRHEVSNGITLCNSCHIKVHKKELDIQSELTL